MSLKLNEVISANQHSEDSNLTQMVKPFVKNDLKLFTSAESRSSSITFIGKTLRQPMSQLLYYRKCFSL